MWEDLLGDGEESEQPLNTKEKGIKKSISQASASMIPW